MVNEPDRGIRQLASDAILTPIIEIRDVKMQKLASRVIAGFSLDAPAPRSRHRAANVEFKGWVLGGRRPVVAVVVRAQGMGRRRFPLDYWRGDIANGFPQIPNAERCGFRGYLDLSVLGAVFEFFVEAEFDDGTTSPLATIGGGAPELQRPKVSRPGTARLPSGTRPATATPGMVGPVVSIVIPVHNQSALTRTVLETLLTPGNITIPFEILVIDDGSSDATLQVLEQFRDRVRWMSLSPNIGFGGACNAGAALARGPYIAFLNNDTIPEPGWVDALVRHAEQHPAAAVVGAKLLYPSGEIQHAGVAFGLDGFPHHLYSGFPAHHPACNHPRLLQAVTAACCLVRTDRFREIDGFDRAYVNGWEDTDLCLRLRERGYEIHYCPDSVILHHESASRDSASHGERRNRETWMLRWKDRVTTDCFRLWAEDNLFALDVVSSLYPVRLRYAPELASVFPWHELLQTRGRAGPPLNSGKRPRLKRTNGAAPRLRKRLIPALRPEP